MLIAITPVLFTLAITPAIITMSAIVILLLSLLLFIEYAAIAIGY